MGHRTGGNEVDTLQKLWEFCNNNSQNNLEQQMVVYLHSKGSFHPSEDNDNLRRFLTRGALSHECATLPHNCTVCSSRMSPIPHSHTSGNMWLAKCSYIQQLLDPDTFVSAMGHKINACFGTGRYASEHWIHSHPSNRPCDLYTNPQFVWNYAGIPTITEFEDNLSLDMAPRFPKALYHTPPGVCRYDGPRFPARMEEYQRLYHVHKPEDDWWGWNFFNQSAQDY